MIDFIFSRQPLPMRFISVFVDGRIFYLLLDIVKNFLIFFGGGFFIFGQIFKQLLNIGRVLLFFGRSFGTSNKFFEIGTEIWIIGIENGLANLITLLE